MSPTNKPFYTVSHDGIYELPITVEAKTPEPVEYSALVTVEVLGPYGYISATDFPFLPVNQLNCGYFCSILRNDIPFTISVLWYNVRSLCNIRYHLVGRFLYAMA